MTNHPGRRPAPDRPDPATIREARDGVLQTQAEAAACVHATRRTWQEWEAGTRKMPLAAWELYLLYHCRPGGMLRAEQWAQWLRPAFVTLLASTEVLRRPAPT